MKAIDYLFNRPCLTVVCLALLGLFILSTLGCTHDEMMILQGRANQEMDQIHEKVEKVRDEITLKILKEMVVDEP